MKKHKWGIQVGVSWLSKILNVLMQILLIPLVFKLLGVEQFALYSFMVGISTWFALCDFSTGVVLQNKIIKNQVDETSLHVNQGIFLKTFYFYILIIIIFSLFFSTIYPLVYKYFIFKLVPSNNVKIMFTWIIFCALYLSNIIFQQNTIRAYYTLDKGFQINLLNLFSSLFSYLLLFLILFIFKIDSLILILVLGNLPSTIINLIAYCQLIGSRQCVSLSEFVNFVKDIIYQSKYFFLFGILGSFVIQLDYLLIAHYLLPNDIIQYNWYTKIFGAVYALFSILLTNYYAVCANNLYKKEWNKVVKGLLWQFGIGAFLIIFCIVFSLMANNLLIKYFYRSQVQLSGAVAVMYGLYFILRAWTDCWSLPLYSLNQGKSMIGIVLLQLIISLPLQVILIKQFGLFGMLVGLALSFLFTVCWLFPFKVYVQFKKFALEK